MYVVLAVLSAAILLGAFSRPIALMLPKETIRSYLLDQLPPGTSKAEVLRFVRDRGLTLRADVKTPDTRFMRVHLGMYRFPFRTDVVAFMHLDDDDEVIDIDVQKHTDSL
jgi:hypothetical protein